MSTTESALRPLAVFDLDGTLVRGDRMMPFLVALAGGTAGRLDREFWRT
jgi:hypothetical protein